MKSKKENNKTEVVNTFSQQTEQTEFIEKLRNSTKAIECPCCGRKAKFYNRKLNAKLCLALIHIVKHYRHHPSQPDQLDYFDYTELFKEHPSLKVDFPKLQYWDLVEAKGTMKKRKGESVFVKETRMYRISENGIKFAQREVAVPLTAVVYNNVVKGHLINPHATIDKILADAGYDYNQLIDPMTFEYVKSK
jgi:hypothetical protein